jgi:hypothetical protein
LATAGADDIVNVELAEAAAADGAVIVLVVAPAALECTCCGTKMNSIAATASSDLQRPDLLISEEHLFEGIVMVV